MKRAFGKEDGRKTGESPVRNRGQGGKKIDIHVKIYNNVKKITLLYERQCKMERNAMQKLEKWKASPRRKPLLLKGIRQVGKTWLLK